MKIQWFKLKRPKDPSEQFKGKTITAYPTALDATERTNGVKISVGHIAGNMRHQTMFQVNGTHLVSMLDAYCELNKEPLPNEEIHRGFLSTVAESVAPESKEKGKVIPLPSAFYAAKDGGPESA